MGYSSAVDTIIESGRIIKRSFSLAVLNGFGAVLSDDFSWIPVQSFEINVTEGVPTIGTLRAVIGKKDYEYFDEFTHSAIDPGNPLMMYAYCLLECTVYLDTDTRLTGTITTNLGSRRIIGVGTLFLSELIPGDIIFVDSNPEIKLLVHDIIDDLTLDTYELASESFAGAACSKVDAEREYLFRGIIRDKQVEDLDIIIEAFDPLMKLRKCLSPIDMEAELEAGSPHADSILRPTPVDEYEPAGEDYIWEIDPTVIGQAWAEDPAGFNRVFGPGAITVEAEIPPASTNWFPVAVSEFQVIPSLGLIEFKENQVGGSFRIEEISVYQEGTLGLEDVVEEILTYDGSPEITCNHLGAAFPSSMLNGGALTGTFTLTNGALAVIGVGCSFDAELSEGDRIAHDATPFTYGIVDSIAGANNLTLKFIYPGATAGPFAGFKSSLRWAGLSLQKIEWPRCDGSASDLLTQLQKKYADVRGYRIWYDPMENLIRGDRIVIDEVNPMQLALKGSLSTTNTIDNFYSAIAVRGTIDRATNLSTMTTTTITPLAVPAWNIGFEHTGGTSWGGMTWCNVAGCETAIIDADTTTAYGNWTSPLVPTNETWYDFQKISLDKIYDLGKMYIYAPVIKNATFSGQRWGVSIEVSIDDVTYTLANEDAYRFNMASNEMKLLDLEGVSARYIKIIMRPIKWVSDGDYATMGLREVIIFGSEKMCEIACIQDHTPSVAPSTGGRTVGGVFIPDYYPNLVDKMAFVGQETLIDNSGLIFSREEALDRAYLLLNEYIRLYRAISWGGVFDPRIQIYDSVITEDQYREGPTEDLIFLVESYTITEESTTISGREYGAGVLAPTSS